VESLEIQYGPSGIVKISGQANSSNILVKSDQTFEYLPGVEMTVENEQRILLQGTTRIRMHMKVNE
jgi:hypothetical protein